MKKLVTWTLTALFAGLVVVAPLVAEEGESGQALYDKKCAMCHGKDGVAKKMGAGSADFNDPEWQKATSLEEVISVTRDGKNKMPAYEKKLSAEEIAALSEFVLKMPAAE